MTADSNYRISGHESFPCRYTWLPKTVRGLRNNPKFFADEKQAMVEMGLGKNMVRSARFWAQAAGITASTKGTYALTKLGNTLLGEHGLDPFLEDMRTLWLIHWKLSTNTQNPLLAWDFLLNNWHEPELAPSAALRALEREAMKRGDGPSLASLDQHFNAFLHTYFPTRSRKGEVLEDNLDCPLIELELIVKVGERDLDRSATGNRETIYAFRREDKPAITGELFLYCLNDFWETRHATEDTLSFKEIAHGHGGPGQVFKLPEEDVRTRVEDLKRLKGGFFTYTESVNIQQVWKQGQQDAMRLIKQIYR